MNNIKQRNSNIEFLRIISMFLILTHHFAVHSDFEFVFGTFSWSKILINILASVGKLGVNIFIVISSFYLTETKVKIKKVLLFILQVTFYSIVMYLVTLLFGNNFSPFDFIKSILPFLFNLYWFATTYIVFYIISPLILKVINNLEKKEYLTYVVILSVLYVIIPTFMYKTIEFSNLAWFIYVYFVIGYIKKYNINFFKNKDKCKIASIIGLSFIIFTVILFNLIGLKSELFFEHSAYFSSMNKLPAFLTSIFIFFWFLNKSKKDNKIINFISKGTFSTYLIHDNPYFSSILWTVICKNKLYNNSILLLPHYILVCILIFTICIIIDLIRIYTIEKTLQIPIDKINNIINKIYKKIEIKLL